MTLRLKTLDFIGMNTTRKSYPSEVSDAEWSFLTPYLTLMRHDAPQREHSLRELFKALRSVVKTGCPCEGPKSSPSHGPAHRVRSRSGEHLPCPVGVRLAHEDNSLPDHLALLHKSPYKSKFVMKESMQPHGSCFTFLTKLPRLGAHVSASQTVHCGLQPTAKATKRQGVTSPHRPRKVSRILHCIGGTALENKPFFR